MLYSPLTILKPQSAIIFGKYSSSASAAPMISTLKAYHLFDDKWYIPDKPIVAAVVK